MRLGGVLVAVALAGLAGCLLPDPDYEDTQFSCVAPPFTCPEGYVCRSGVCESGRGLPDAGADVGDPDPDAGPEPVADNDAAPDDDPPEPDAGVLPTTTLAFGERPGSDVTGVTSDSTIRENDQFDNFGNDDEFIVDADPVIYGLLRFDLSAIPAGSQVLSAELDIEVTNPIETGDYLLYQLLEDWEEDEVTYIKRRDGQLWSKAGAEAPGSAAAAPSVTFTPRAEGAYTLAIPAALVQSWVNTPSSNHGLIWRSNSPDGRGGDMASKEATNADHRPQLRVTFR